MVSDFLEMKSHPVDPLLLTNVRKFSTPIRGQRASAMDMVTIGIHRSPEEVVREAAAIGHPTRLHSMSPDDISRVVPLCLDKGCRQMAMSRTEEIKRWISLASDLAGAEAGFKKGMSSRRKEVLANKKLILLKTLLGEGRRTDDNLYNLVDQLADGFDLTGTFRG